MALEFDVIAPLLRTRDRMVRLSSESEPAIDDDGGTLQVGTELLYEDTGTLVYWNGSVWKRPTFRQKLEQFIELQIEIRDLLTNFVESEASPVGRMSISFTNIYSCRLLISSLL
jgi:hypothetical protein